MAIAILAPHAGILAAAVVLDLLIGDPQYRAHPVRLMGHSISFLERRLRAVGLSGYGGGIVLGLSMTALWCGVGSALFLAIDRWSHGVAIALHIYLVYSLLALRGLLDHAWAVESAVRRNDLSRARRATSLLVGRDTGHLSFAECRRAAMESVSENLTDGYVSPLFWYLIAGLPGIVLFKVFSTLDSMVGYKSGSYIRFGWLSARTDDVLNWFPARLTWLLITLTAFFVPRCSAGKALKVGWSQHALLPSPNSGWSEAAMAGAIQRRLVGRIRRGGVLVMDLWLGDSGNPPAGDDQADVRLTMTLCAAAGLVMVALCIGSLLVLGAASWGAHA